MVYARWQASILDADGNVVPGAAVEVRSEASGLLATLWSDRAGTVGIGNPFTADSEGFAFFHAAGGAYRITATAGGFVRQWRYVGVGTAGERDLEGGDVTGPGSHADGHYALWDGVNTDTLKDGGAPPTVALSGDYADLDNIPALEPLGATAGVVVKSGTSNTLALTDVGKLVETSNGAANTLTFPPNGTVPIPVNTILHGCQTGAGQTQIVAGAGVTVRQRQGHYKVAGQWGGWTAWKRATNEWVIWGDLAA